MIKIRKIVVASLFEGSIAGIKVCGTARGVVWCKPSFYIGLVRGDTLLLLNSVPCLGLFLANVELPFEAFYVFDPVNASIERAFGLLTLLKLNIFLD